MIFFTITKTCSQLKIMIRLYTANDLYHGALFSLTETQYHYLYRVMRQINGNEVFFFNGKQGLWRGALQKHQITIIDCIQEQPAVSSPLFLFFSPIKNQNWLIEKATELGVTHFFPTCCMRSVIRTVSYERYTKIILEACEQSGQLQIPEMMSIKSLHKQLDTLQTGPVIALDPKSTTLLRNISIRPTGLFIGPEGGFYDDELKALSEHRNIQSAHLGQLILRAETAALAGVAVVNALWGS